MSKIRAVIVSYSDPQAAARAVKSLRDQTVDLSEIVVVNNRPNESVVETGNGVTLIEPATNLGYAGGANLGALGSDSDWLFFLNPDAVAAEDCLSRLLDAAGDAEVGAVGAQVLLPDGRVNAGDNPLHISGLSWSGRYGEPPEAGPPRDVAVVSGAAVLVRTAAWEALGGLAEEFFLYYDDVDFALRLQIAGWRVVFQPAAIVEHDYEFDKGDLKWFYLERNRAWSIATVPSSRTLLLLAPLLAASEIGLLGRAIREGWWRQKLRAWRSVLSNLTAIEQRRRVVQATRTNSDRDWLQLTRSAVDSPLAASSAARAAAPLLSWYRRVVIWAAG